MSPSRKTPFDVGPQGRWDLSDLLSDPGEGELARRIADLDAGVARFVACRPELDAVPTPDRLREILSEYQALVEQMHVLGAYGSLWFASDTQSPAALTFRNRVEQVLTGLGNRTLFFGLWWQQLDDTIAGDLLPDEATDADARHFLLDLRRLEPFTLDERTEQVINVKDANGMSGLLTLYSMLTNRLEYSLEVDGETRRLTRDELSAYTFSPRAELREAAYRELLSVLDRESNVLSQIYVNRVRDWHAENVELRGHGSPIAVRNAANDLPDAAVEALLAAASDHAPVFQRYFRLKARELGVERLRRYDIYAPLGTSDRRISWEDGVGLVLDTFAGFDDEFARRARRVFADGHVDSEIRKGKKGGAFCATVLPRLTPWLLVNYTGRVRDVATLAHELGHAVHSMLAEGHSVLVQHPSLPLAETASVFAEMLLTDRLLSEETDPSVRRELLAASLDDVYATVMRQAYFVRFEVEAHRMILEGRSPEELDEVYLGLLAEQFGDSLDIDPSFRREWVGIPHLFHTPFYCYAYSFGQLLVLALYRRYQAEGRSFVPGYLRMLSYGGAASPLAILAEVGVDPEDPEFWRGGFEVVSERVDELETLGAAVRS